MMKAIMQLVWMKYWKLFLNKTNNKNPIKYTLDGIFIFERNRLMKHSLLQ